MLRKEQPKNLLLSNRDLRVLIVPLIIEMALKLIVGMIDSVMVASVGEAAVSGVSLVDSIMQLLIYIFAALASGGAVVAGQYLGAKKQKEARDAATELLWLNLVLAVVIMIVVFGLSDWMLTHLFGRIEADVFQYGKQYFDIVVFSIPAIAVFEAGTSIFRTMNRAKVTMKLSLLMNLINVFGNAVLIYGCSMGTRGAAFATLVSRWIAAVLIVILLLDSRRELYVEKTWKHRFRLSMSGSIMAMGIPGGVENGIFQLGKIAILGLVAEFGTMAITANAVAQTMGAIEMIPGSAIQLAVVTIIARCVGAEDYEQAKYFNRKLLWISYIVILGWSIVLMLVLPLVLRLYHLSPQTAELVTRLFYCHVGGAVLLWPIAFNLSASLRAAGDVQFPMLISIFSMWAFRFGGAWVLAKPLGFGVTGIWIAMAYLDWGFRALCFEARWIKGKWETKQIMKKNA